MCDEKQSVRVNYIVCRLRKGKPKPTGWRRTNAPACRTRYSRWMVYHNGRWMELHRSPTGTNYIVVK